MPINTIQLLAPPGGPGVIGGIKAGTNVSITGDGRVNATSGTPGVTSVSGSNGVSVSSSTGNVTVNAITAAAQPFQTGTTILVLNSTAPPGYTRLTSQDNYALRVVSGSGGGTGGSVDFTTAFNNITPTGTYNVGGITISGTTGSGTINPSGNYSVTNAALGGVTLDTNTFANHNHTVFMANNDGPAGSYCSVFEDKGNIDLGTTRPTDFSNASQSHNHGIPDKSATWNLDPKTHTHTWNATSANSSQNFSGNNLNVQVKYIDAILCSKN